MASVDKYRKIEILGDGFIYLTNEEKLGFLFQPDKHQESFFEKIILNDSDQIDLIFNSKLFVDLDSYFLEAIFKSKINDIDTLFSFACSKNSTILGILLNSKAFTKLNNSQQYEILKIRPVSDIHDIPLLMKAILRSDVNCLSEIMNSPTLINLEQKLIFDLLNDKDAQNRNSLQKSVKSPIHFKILFGSKFFQKLTSEQKFILLTNQDKNKNTLLFDYIHIDSKKQAQDFFHTLFDSSIFKEFNETQQKYFLYLNQNHGKELWLYLTKKQNNISDFVKYGPKFLIPSFFDFVQDYYWDKCCQKDIKPDYLRSIISLSDILDMVSSSSLSKNAVDSSNFSILYYLLSYGLPIDELRKYQQDGFKIITKGGYEAKVHESNIEFTCENAKRDILIINGKYTKNDIISGLEAALHQSCFNILALNANYNPLGKNTDIESIISNYVRKTSLDLIIINAHGTQSHVEARKSIDVLLFIYEHTNKIASKDLFKQFIQATEKNDPIDIFITSCNGQLATKVINASLPVGSRVITLGEVSSNTKIHSTQMDDVQAISNTIKLYNIRPDQVSNKHLLDLLLINYYMHLSASKLIKGIPTYTIVPNKTFPIAEIKNDRIGTLNPVQVESLMKILCNDQDIICAEKVKSAIANWDHLKFGDPGSIERLQKSSNLSSDFGVVSAIKFADYLYCQNSFEDNSNLKIDFCALPMGDQDTCSVIGTTLLAASIIGVCCYYCGY